METTQCRGCGEQVEEVCRGEYCRKCHVSLTFEDCIDNVSVNKLRKRYGLEPVEGQKALVKQ